MLKQLIFGRAHSIMKQNYYPNNSFNFIFQQKNYDEMSAENSLLRSRTDNINYPDQNGSQNHTTMYNTDAQVT